MLRLLTVLVLTLALLLPLSAHAITLGTDACGGAGDIGANWTVVTGFELPQQTGGICQAKTLNVVAEALHTAVAWANDQWAQIKVVTATSAPRIDGVILRGTTAARTGYECHVAGAIGGSAATLTIYRLNAGAATSLVTSGAAATVSSGDTMYCEVQGSTVLMKINGVTVLGPTVDGTPIASGTAGVLVFSSATNLNQAQLDDWAGGDFTAGACRGGLSLLGVGGC